MLFLKNHVNLLAKRKKSFFAELIKVASKLSTNLKNCKKLLVKYRENLILNKSLNTMYNTINSTTPSTIITMLLLLLVKKRLYMMMLLMILNFLLSCIKNISSVLLMMIFNLLLNFIIMSFPINSFMFMMKMIKVLLCFLTFMMKLEKIKLMVVFGTCKVVSK